jgi:hypothetical protein
VDVSGFAGSRGAWVVKVFTPMAAGLHVGLARRRHPIFRAGVSPVYSMVSAFAAQK